MLLFKLIIAVVFTGVMSCILSSALIKIIQEVLLCQ